MNIGNVPPSTGPKSQEELDALWATALDKAKNRVKNRIEELQLAIDREERIKKSKTVQNYNIAIVTGKQIGRAHV